MNEKTIVLVHPASRSRIHYANEHGASLCGYVQEHQVTDKGTWELCKVSLTGDSYVCHFCKLARKRKENLPPPAASLPCTEPEKPVILWVRSDSKGLVHSCNDQKSQSRCGIKNQTWYSDRWGVQSGRAREITCSLCLKSEGLHEGHTPYKHKRRFGGVDWPARLARWEAG